MGKAFEKQLKTIEEQGEKQVMALNTLKSDNNNNNNNNNYYYYYYYYYYYKLTIKDVISRVYLLMMKLKKNSIKLKK